MPTDVELTIERFKARYAENESEAIELQKLYAYQKEELENTTSKLAIANARLDEGRAALVALEAIGQSVHNQSPKKRPARKGKGRGRPMSDNWQAIFLEFPVSPDPVIPITSVYEIVKGLGIEYSENTIRSQLSAFKKKGLLESVDGGWRLLKTLDEAEKNKGSEDQPEPTRPQGRRDGISEDLLNGTSHRPLHIQEGITDPLAR